MKLQRNNKYKNKIALGLSTLMLSSLLLTGCSNEIELPIDLPKQTDEIVETMEPITTELPIETPVPTPEPTPVVTQEVIPTTEPVVTEMPIVTETPVVTPEPTPIVTLEPTPEVTPEPSELTEEETIELEIEKLCLANPKREIDGIALFNISFSKEDKIKVLPIEMIMAENNMIDLKDIFSETVLMKIPYSLLDPAFEESTKNSSAYLFKDLKEYEAVSNYFTDIDNLCISRIWYNFYRSPYKNEDISRDEVTNFIIELIGIDPRKTGGIIEYDPAAHKYIIENIARTYVKYIPENYRVNAYDLNPELNQELEEGNSKTK